MFGVGMTELVVILVIALLIFGPNKLPELARSLGKGFGEFRRASYDLRQSLVEASEPDPPPRTPAEGGPSIHRDEPAKTASAGDAKPAEPGDPSSQGGA